MRTPSIPYWPSWGAAALLALLIGAVFWPVLGFDFVRWDDDINITENALLREPWSWRLGWHFFDPQVAMRFKPLHWMIARLVFGLGGLNPAIWHLLGLLMHSCAAVLLSFSASGLRDCFCRLGEAPTHCSRTWRATSGLANTLLSRRTSIDYGAIILQPKCVGKRPGKS
jgi:hypothetical protein